MARKYDDKAGNKNPGPGSYKQNNFVDEKKPSTKKSTFA